MQQKCYYEKTTEQLLFGFYKTQNTVGSIHLHWGQGDSTTEARALIKQTDAATCSSWKTDNTDF